MAEDSDPGENLNAPSTSNNLSVPGHTITTPVVSRNCEKAKKVRALAYNDDRKVRGHNSGFSYYVV